MFKSFTTALFPQIHTQQNYDFSARDRKKLSDSKMKKPDSRYAEMGIGERTGKGEPAPGQGDARGEIGEPSEPSDMSPEEKRQVEGADPTFAGRPTTDPKSKL